MKNFEFDLLGVITKYFPSKASSRTWLKCNLPFLTQKASYYKDLK